MLGDEVIVKFPAGDSSFAEYLVEKKAALEIACAELAGRPLRVFVRTEEAPEVVPPAAPPIQDDPVLRSFQKHLGGEVVSRGSRRSNQED
jgi:hypothetical protein